LDRNEPEPALNAARLLTEARFPVAGQQAGWWLSGRAHRAAGRAAEAKKAMEQALGLGARTVAAAEAGLLLGELALEAGQATEADARFRAAAAVPAPEDRPDLRARAYHGMGRAALALGKPAEAARFFMSVAILYDDKVLVPQALAQAAEAFQAAGDTEAATKALAERTTRFPDFKPALAVE